MSPQEAPTSAERFDERLAFERWASARGMALERCGHGYYDRGANWAWAAWQAARTAGVAR